MAIKFIDYQTSFKWQVDVTGLPIANVIALGSGRWVTVCPCCGMAHDVTGVQGDTYTPRCTLKTTHPKVFANWRQQYPDAAKHSQIALQRFGAETIITKPAAPEKRAA